MQNAQVLEHTNGLAKYVCKYITKIDEGNYVVLCVDVHTGQWVLAKTHLHNTKIVSSKINEDARFRQQKFKHHPKGRDNGYFELRQFAMGHPEVLTDLDWMELSTLPFELRPTNRIKLDDKGDVIKNPPDVQSAGIPMQRARQELQLREEQQMTASQVVTYRNHHGNSTRYCRISEFSLRPVELLKVFRNPIDYFRCCIIFDRKILNEEGIKNLLSGDLNRCSWVDCLGRRVAIRKKTLNKVLVIAKRNLQEFDETADNGNEFYVEMNEFVTSLIEKHIARETPANHENETVISASLNSTCSDDAFRASPVYVTQSQETDVSSDEDTWSGSDIDSMDEQQLNFIDTDNTARHLPIPVPSNSDPRNPHQFLTHLILSLGKYDTEVDALTHGSFVMLCVRRT